MPATPLDSSVSAPSHPVALDIRRRRARLIVILSAVSMLGVILALSAGILAGQSKENARGLMVLGWMSAGACALLWLPLASFTYTKRARAVDELANNPNVLARWRYTAEEQAAFVIRERERVRLKRKDFIVLPILFVGIGLLVCIIGKFLSGWSSQMMVGVLIASACGSAFFTLLIFIGNRRTLAALPESFAGEVVIGRQGLLTVKQISQWSTGAARLIAAEFTPGEPGELYFKIRTIVQTQEGSSETIENLRVPVPKGHDEEARTLVAALLNG